MGRTKLRINLWHIMVSIAACACLFTFGGATTTMGVLPVILIVLLPIFLASRSQRLRVAMWVVSVYPALFLASLYATWFTAWCVWVTDRAVILMIQSLSVRSLISRVYQHAHSWRDFHLRCCYVPFLRSRTSCRVFGFMEPALSSFPKRPHPDAFSGLRLPQSCDGICSWTSMSWSVGS